MEFEEIVMIVIRHSELRSIAPYDTLMPHRSHRTKDRDLGVLSFNL